MADSALTLQNNAIAKADAYNSQMQTFLRRLDAYSSGAVSSYVPTASITSTLDTSGLQAELQTLLDTIQLEPPEVITGSSFNNTLINVPAIVGNGVPIPVFPTVSAPTVALPVAPKVGQRTFGGQRPNLTYGSGVSRPTLNLPPAPQFENLVLPQLSQFVPPAAVTDTYLGAGANGITLPDPTTQYFSGDAAAPSTTLNDAARSKLLSDVTSGGYGIEPRDEDRLWQREVSREMRASNSASDDIARTMAGRGFMLPPGAMLAQLAAASQGAAERLSASSREIAIKRGDMYVENRRFALSQALEQEKHVGAMYNAYRERANTAAKAMIDFAVAVGNAQISKFNAQIANFSAHVNYYSEQVRTAMAALETDKLALEGIRLRSDVKKSEIEVYAARINGQESLINLYRADVDALNSATNAERLKLEAYRVDVEVFSEQVKGEMLQLQGYEAQVRGNVAAVEVYKTQIEAQGVQANVVQSQAAIIETNARTVTENLRTQIASAQMNVDAYRASVTATASNNESQSRAFAARTEAFRALAGIYDSMSRVQVSEADMDLRAAVENVRAVLEATKTQESFILGVNGMAVENLGKGIQSQLSQVLGIATTITNATA